MSSSSARAALERAARRHGVVYRYTDAWGEARSVGDATLTAIVDTLTSGTARDAPPPVVVAWDGVVPEPRALAGLGVDEGTLASFELRSEGGERLGRVGTTGPGPRGTPPARLPYGVHEIADAGGSGRTVARVVSAPSRADLGGLGTRDRSWGIVAPLYAVRDRRCLPTGDLTSLEELGSLVARCGGDAVATLPLLAELSTADGAAPGQHPYSPVSRMFWNEAYLDLARVPEIAGRRDIAGSVDRGRDATARMPADLAGRAAAARPLLDEAVRTLEATGGARLTAFRGYLAEQPELLRYARFRAGIEAAGPDPRRWPGPWRAGTIPEAEVSPQAERRHAYAQWVTDAQLAETAQSLRAQGVGLVLDLPVGCAASGYDPWAWPDAYVRDMSIGAPPDAFFTSGQCWGFPPPHPAAERASGYRTTRACLAHGLRHAAALRVDHVLGWSRLWWVPDGTPPDQGAYVRYPLDEILAVASLEAWNARSSLVGEDLGTVERRLRSTLTSHGVAGMDVAVFALEHQPTRRLRTRRGGVALVDTHDTATFAGWFGGSDIALRADLGLLPAALAATEQSRRGEARSALMERLVGSGALDPARASDPLAVLSAVLEELGSSDARLVLVQAEDLWAELDAHNLPGTTTEHANFARRHARRLDEIAADPKAREILARLDAARRSEPRRRR